MWLHVPKQRKHAFMAVLSFSLASLSSTCLVFLFWMGSDRKEGGKVQLYDTNNYFENVDVLVAKDRQRSANNLKAILMWNGAYDSSKRYDGKLITNVLHSHYVMLLHSVSPSYCTRTCIGRSRKINALVLGGKMVPKAE